MAVFAAAALAAPSHQLCAPKFALLVWFALLSSWVFATGQEVELPEGWEALPDVGNGPIQEHGVAALDGAIYVVGGIDGMIRTVQTVNRYNLDTRKWSLVKDMPTALHHPNVAAVDGKLYALGGFEGLQFADVSVGAVLPNNVPFPCSGLDCPFVLFLSFLGMFCSPLWVESHESERGSLPVSAAIAGPACNA